MKLDHADFRQLGRLAPVLDDLLNAGVMSFPSTSQVVFALQTGQRIGSATSVPVIIVDNTEVSVRPRDSGGGLRDAWRDLIETVLS